MLLGNAELDMSKIDLAIISTIGSEKRVKISMDSPGKVQHVIGLKGDVGTETDNMISEAEAQLSKGMPRRVLIDDAPYGNHVIYFDPKKVTRARLGNKMGDTIAAI